MKSCLGRKPRSPGQGVTRSNSPFKEVSHWEEKLKEIMGTSTEKTKPWNGKQYPGGQHIFCVIKGWLAFVCPIYI